MVTAYQLAARVPDPELPALTIDELGILRGVRERRHGDRARYPGHVDTASDVEVAITPTYSGCPALDTIRTEIEKTLHDNGFGCVSVTTRLSPPWTTDWISPMGREKLRENGIAPPGAAGVAGTSGPPRTVGLTLAVRCPHCGSPETEQLGRFGSTACKAIWRCLDCAEPFEAVKPL